MYFSQHTNGWPSLCPQRHTLSPSEVDLRQHPWVRTTAASLKYLSKAVNDAVKSVYWHQACSCQTAPVFIFIPASLPLDQSSQQHLMVLLQNAGARLPNTGQETEQGMFKNLKIWILVTSRSKLGYPWWTVSRVDSQPYLALNNKSKTKALIR